MTQAENHSPSTIVSSAAVGAYGSVYFAIAIAACILWWLTRNHASLLPLWAPWEFSWLEFLSAWLTIYWYIRGVTSITAAERPSLLRRVSFFAGMLVIYAVLETHFEYLAEHQFFFNRIQHVAMHHLGPLLIALSWPGAEIKRGMPASLRRVVEHRIPIRIVHILQQPILAAFLFVGSFFFWLIPSIHFHAMIDPRLFALMNWTMVIDGILFWCLVLDPRPSPPARVSFGWRAALATVVMFPQILGGAIIVFNRHDLYTFYDLCGRIYPNIGAHYDQTIGGLITWIPPAMMSVVALVLVLNAMRLSEERNLANDTKKMGPPLNASPWTG
ncbi:cytochrome c oxidase assembly protein [Nitrobacter sp.]|uniref:cytochrome c oxidase assembly protein n=1 Tax=Nitrobacter sp. TaxID=29420 RepID=UPI00399D589B